MSEPIKFDPSLATSGDDTGAVPQANAAPSGPIKFVSSTEQNPISTGEAAGRSFFNGFLFNQLPRVTAAAKASGLTMEGPDKPPTWEQAGPIESGVGALRLGAEYVAPSIFGRKATDVYEKTLAEEYEKRKAAEEQHPYVTFGGRLAGTIANPITRATGTPVGGASFGSNFVRGAVPGGIIGGIEGSGEEAKTWSETGQNVLKGMGLGGLFGGVVGGTVGKILPSGSDVLPSNAPTGQTVAEAAERLGVNVPKAVATDSPTLARASSVVSDIPFTGGRLKEAAKDTQRQLSEKVAELSGGENPANVGADAKVALVDWMKNGSRKLVDEQYDRVDSLITNPKATQTLDNTIKTAQEIQNELGAAKIQGLDPAVDEVLNAVTDPSGLTYNGIKTLRTRIGQMLDNPTDAVRTAEPSLRRLYGSLTDDLQEVIKKGGGDKALNAFEHAGDFAKTVNEWKESLVKATGPQTTSKSAETVFGNIIRYAQAGKSGDIELLNKIRSVMPQDVWDRVSLGAVDALSRDTKNVSSIDSFFTNFNKLSDEGKDVLFGANGANPMLRESIDDLATIGSRIDRLRDLAGEESKAGRIGLSLGEVAAFMYHPIKTTAGVIAGRSFANSMSKPATVEAMQNMARSYQLFLSKPSQVAANAFYNSLKALAVTEGGEGNIPSANQAVNALIAANQGLKAGRYLYNIVSGQNDKSSSGSQSNLGGSNQNVNPFAGQADGGRVGRKEGGRVANHVAEKLYRELTRNKKMISGHTEQMLAMPDDAIVQALHTAKNSAM